ncbi:phosphate starvation-inducible protein PhoH [Erysipelothrix rhusiopathiae SY1027]|nr:phosphate starvation-inducible protein PhoH [Erysipelothrix rhusiopathiae SY1027]
MVTQTVNLNELEISLQQLVGIENKNIRHIEKIMK